MSMQLRILPKFVRVAVCDDDHDDDGGWVKNGRGAGFGFMCYLGWGVCKIIYGMIIYVPDLDGKSLNF